MRTFMLFLMLYSCVSTVALIGVFKSDRLERKWLNKYFSPHLVIVLKFAFSFLIIIPCLYFLLASIDIGPSQNIGQVGDFIGGLLNPLLSFMALIAVLVSIKTQETAQIKQESLISKQLFETSLFNLMEMLRVRRGELPMVKVKGVDESLFLMLAKMLRDKRKEIDAKGLGVEEAHEEAIECIDAICDYQHFQVLRSQFRVIIDFIEGASLDFEQKTKYYRIFYIDFSQIETVCIANVFFRYPEFRDVLRRHNLVKTKDENLVSAKMRIFYADNPYNSVGPS